MKMNTASPVYRRNVVRFACDCSLALVALLGLFVVGFLGFSHMEVVAQCRPRLPPFDGLSLPLTRG